MRSNLTAIRQRVERLAAMASTSTIDVVALLRRRFTQPRLEPEPLTTEQRTARTKAFRDRMRALGVLPPL